MSASDHNYDVRPLIGEEDSLEDLSFSLGSKTWRMWGRDGAERERNLAERSTGTGLPVLLGSGLGVGLELLARNGPVAVVDREEPILELTGVQERFREDPNVLWLQNDTRECMKVLAEWQAEHGGRPLEPLAVPIYLRLDPDHYRTLATALAKGARADFWEEARYPKFRNSAPKVLLLERPYFLYREIAAALDRMGIERRNVDIGSGDTVRQGFVEDFLEAVVDFRPDMALTVNHLGLDREGRLTGLLERLGLPLASWFVDSPRLVLHEYQGLATPGTILFTWDKSSLEPLAAAGYQQTFHLPLATDPHLFQPDAPPPSRGAEHLPAGVSFVGASMIRQVRERLEYARPGPAFLRRLEAVAQALSRRGDTDVPGLLKDEFPKVHEEYLACSSMEHRLALEALVTWEATRLYRTDCVRALLPFRPVIAGDPQWKDALKGGDFTLLPPLDYYRDLPGLYARTDVGFNCTSVQMPGAVNQRVFDIPAAGGFLLTDRPEAMAELFDPDRECVCYAEPEDVPELVKRYLRDGKERARIAGAARKRVLAKHTYDLRMERILDRVRQCTA